MLDILENLALIWIVIFYIVIFLIFFGFLRETDKGWEIEISAIFWLFPISIFLEYNSNLNSIVPYCLSEETQLLVKTSNNLRCGDQTKFGDGARAKSDAAANAGRLKSSSADSGTNLFVEGFTPQQVSCSNYHNDRTKASCRKAHEMSNCPKNSKSILPD